MMMPAQPRLLVYSQDGLGLGHLRRTSSLVTEFLGALPNACVLTISDSPLGKFFATEPNHDYLKLPSIQKLRPGDWRAVSLPVPFPEVLALRSRLIRSVALSFRPDVLLVDHMPHGAMGELGATLDVLRDMPVRTVLGLRDILDAPHVIRRRWLLEGAYEAVASYYDEVLVYGSREVFDHVRQYAWPEESAGRVRYCGYVSPPPEARRPQSVRSRHLAHSPSAKFIVGMVGAGADGHVLLRTLVDALPAINRAQPCVVVLVTGPFMPEADRRDLKERARGLPVHIRHAVDDSRSYIGAADLVLSMAGYNTTVEILSLGRPALLVPREGPSAEQRLRAQLFAERGWVRFLTPEQLEPHALAEAVLGCLAEHPRGPSEVGPNLDGRTVATRHLLDLLDGDLSGEADAALPIDAGGRRLDLGGCHGCRRGAVGIGRPRGRAAHAAGPAQP